MSAERFLCWMFGVGFVFAFVMSQFAISQRDEARSFKANLGTNELVCKAVKP
jgi:hypothetical protein